jgi:hypothetical protein
MKWFKHNLISAQTKPWTSLSPKATPWEKDNYQIREGYAELVREILQDFEQMDSAND